MGWLTSGLNAVLSGGWRKFATLLGGIVGWAVDPAPGPLAGVDVFGDVVGILIEDLAEVARERLEADAENGSAEALHALGAVRSLPTALVIALIGSVSNLLDNQVRAFQSGVYGAGGPD